MNRKFDLDSYIGKTYGYLKIIGFSKDPQQMMFAASPIAICECKCGNVTHKSLRVLTESHPKTPFSCGCAYHEARNNKRTKRVMSYIGKTFGDLTVLEFVGDSNDPEKFDLVKCKCKCGNEFDIRIKNLLSLCDYQREHPNTTVSCNECSKKNRVQMIWGDPDERVANKYPVGSKYDMLTVIGHPTDEGYSDMIEFKCECGKTCRKRSHNFDGLVEKYKKYKKSNITYRISCGCKEYENRSNTIRTGINRGGSLGVPMYKEKLYSVWTLMHQRCKNPNNDMYPVYGGRGIYVCDEWTTPKGSKTNTGYLAFREWALENGYKPDCGLSIDRRDNDGPYAPWNCRWATKDMQASNTSQNKHIRYNGQVYTYSQFLRYMSEQSGHTWKMVDLHYYIKRGLSLNQMVWNMLHPDDKVYIQSAKGHHMNKRFQGCLVDKNGFARLIPKYDIELLD